MVHPVHERYPPMVHPVGREVSLLYAPWVERYPCCTPRVWEVLPYGTPRVWEVHPMVHPWVWRVSWYIHTPGYGGW